MASPFKKAATLFGVDQPKVSALLRGKLEGFSTDRLFRFLNALGQDVEIIIRPARRAEEQARTRVLTGSRRRPRSPPAPR